MKQILTTIVILGSLLTFDIDACDCGYLGAFVYSNQATDIVVYGKVIEYDSIGTHGLRDNPHSMKFLVLEKLRGIETKDTIIVWGDNGYECRPYIEHFEPNTEWILALDKYNHSDSNHYEISICGEFYVPVNEGMVKGQIFGWRNKNDIKLYSYEFIKELVSNPFDYPLQRPRKALRGSRDGLVYQTNCDFLPQNTLDFRSINKVVNKSLNVPEGFMSNGDSYQINARVIIDVNGGFYFNGTYRNIHKPSIDQTMIENQLDKILRKTGKWKCGLEAGKPVTAELIVPILLEK